MQTFKKALLSIVLLAAMVGGVSFFIVSPYLNSHSDYNQDSEILDNMAGDIDCVVVGASHALCSFVPDILDRELGVTSYNLSTILMPFSARYVMLERELARNPVSTAVLEISYDGLWSDSAQDYGWGESIMFARLDTWPERLSYLCKYVKPNQWLDVYARTMNNSLSAWKQLLLNGEIPDNTMPNKKGFYPRETIDVSINEEQLREIYHTQSCMTGFRKENIVLFDKMISLCQSHNTRVIIAVAPCAESYLCEYNDLDEFDAWMEEFAQNRGCEFYDFNLIANRFDIINDKTSFLDDSHMSEQGAHAFTREFAEIIKKAENGDELSQYFYKSYDELAENSPYYSHVR